MRAYPRTEVPTVKTFEESLPAPFVDEAADATYYGWAVLGVGEDEEAWRIMREKKDGTVTKREYAMGSLDFAFAWTKRTEYDYSR